MNRDAISLDAPLAALSADDAALIRDSLLCGLDAYAEVKRLKAIGLPVMDPDPSGERLCQIAAGLRQVI